MSKYELIRELTELREELLNMEFTADRSVAVDCIDGLVEYLTET
jgi:hypothetical protein